MNNVLIGSQAKKIWMGIIGIDLLATAALWDYALSDILQLCRDGYYSAFVLGASAMITNTLATIPSFSILVVNKISEFVKPDELPPPALSDEKLPFVTVQIPTYNEPFDVVKATSLRSALALDYPANRLKIQVVDNSNQPEKYAQMQAYCKTLANQGINVEFIHRDGRDGGKARNLNIGLGLKDINGKYVSAEGDIFFLVDSDIEFPPDLLRLSAPEFVYNEKLPFAIFEVIDEGHQNLFSRPAALLNQARSKNVKHIEDHGLTTLGGYGTLYRKSALEDIWGWQEDKVGEDWATGIALRAYQGRLTVEGLESNIKKTKLNLEVKPIDIHAELVRRKWVGMDNYILKTVTSKNRTSLINSLAKKFPVDVSTAVIDLMATTIKGAVKFGPGKRISYVQVVDRSPADLVKLKIQQKRWAKGTVETYRDILIPKLWRAGHVPWNEKIDISLRMSYYFQFVYTGLLYPLLFEILKTAGALNMDTVGLLENVWLYMLGALFASLALDAISIAKTGDLKKALITAALAFPAIINNGAISLAVASGLKEGMFSQMHAFQVTPKGKQSEVSWKFRFLETLQKNSNELLIGLGLLSSVMYHNSYKWMITSAGISYMVAPFVHFIKIPDFSKLSKYF